MTHALLLVTTVERQDIRPKTAELHLALQTKEDPEAKEDREVMLFVSNVVRRDITRTSVRTIEVKAVETKFEATNKILRTIKGKIKETLKEITKHQPALKEDAEHLEKYTAYVRSDLFEGQFRYQDNTRKQGNNEDTSSKAMLAINGVGFNGSDMADDQDKPQQDDIGFINSGCSRHMTENIAYLSDFKEFDGGYVTFGGGAHGGRISSKRTLKTNSLDFEDVYFVNKLNFNLFSILIRMCDKKNYVLFTNTECLILSPNFKLPDESQILLKIPKKDNMYSFDMKNIVPKESLTCLVVKEH
ncbi:hypothetical protein Tco_0820584 [Tanacetum coccineum]|uniref:Retrovirus-related Pol polyprotein from transposon TNT 1-94-like beta-barrel domain-containing protein n=1 Tax=Tanacetum coccineum TaxID=301880 RepID=A0ABQ5A9V3_9ASTR